MVYKNAVMRVTRTLPVYGLWNGDLDTANGQDRKNYRQVYEAKERFKFLKQKR